MVLRAFGHVTSFIFVQGCDSGEQHAHFMLEDHQSHAFYVFEAFLLPSHLNQVIKLRFNSFLRIFSKSLVRGNPLDVINQTIVLCPPVE